MTMDENSKFRKLLVFKLLGLATTTFFVVDVFCSPGWLRGQSQSESSLAVPQIFWKKWVVPYQLEECALKKKKRHLYYTIPKK